MVCRTGSGKLLRQRHVKCGFTLIEMLVVMAILALLLTIALPRYFGSLQHAKETALRENLQVIRTTLDKFYADKGRYPQSLDELVELKYLRAVPADPLTESNRTWQLVQGDSTGGLTDVRSGALGSSSDGVPYSAY
jgi:general secretion pathway protein G